LKKRRAHHPQGDPMLHTGLLKAYMDGSLGSRTALMLQPYSDEPKNSGLAQFDAYKLEVMTRERVAEGFQPGFHAIGDKGVEMALDAFQAAFRMKLKKDSRPDIRFRVEHAQVVAPRHYERFRELGAIASMQPNHLLTDMNWAEAHIGPERAKHSYAWSEFLKAGVALAFGTDYPVEPLTPFRGLYAAVTRKNEEGTATYPGDPISIHAAIGAYTSAAAYAEFSEEDKGTLEVGKFADFVVLDRDLTRAKPQEILETNVLRTVLGGKTVYESRQTR
jgi:predicted amidohydrolase YtcJ